MNSIDSIQTFFILMLIIERIADLVVKREKTDSSENKTYQWDEEILKMMREKAEPPMKFNKMGIGHPNKD